VHNFELVTHQALPVEKFFDLTLVEHGAVLQSDDTTISARFCAI
jgi:hypothetical protein